MSHIITRDGTKIFYKDWGTGQPIVFSHGWPLTADAWDGQMLFFAEKGYRVIAHDRRGHGRSMQTSEGNHMDQYADDLAELMDQLDVEDAILVGHSTGGGELTRYIGRHGTERVSKIILVGAVPPLMLKTAANPSGLPRELFDGIRKSIASNRAQYLKETSLPFYGYNRQNAKTSEGILESFWLQGMMGGIKPHYDCVEQFSETDFTEDLKKFDVPTLLIHGDDDQIVPIGISSQMSVKLISGARLKIYPGAGHGLAQTHQEQFNADLLEFIEAEAQKSEGKPSQSVPPKTPSASREVRRDLQ